MTTEQLKAKYPQAIEMIDSLDSPEAVFYFRANRTVHKNDNGTYYYNYEGVHIREFKNLEHLVKWFFSIDSEEESKAEEELKEFVYSRHLSVIKDSEVWLDEDRNVAEDYCDFTNEDFVITDLELAKEEL